MLLTRLMKLYSFLGINDPVSSLTHFLAAGMVLAGSYFLYRKGRGDTLRTAALLLFSASLLFLFSMSGVYHALKPGPWRIFFRRLDYAGIWIVIAGSATPVHMLLLKGFWRWGLTTLFWSVALTCLVLIDYYFSRLPYWSIVASYIGCGLLGVLSFSRITSHHGWRESTLLSLGGAAYIVGALIDAIETPVVLSGVLGPHELFHLFVILGAGLHWWFIYNRSNRSLLAPHATLPARAPGGLSPGAKLNPWHPPGSHQARPSDSAALE